VTIFIIARGRVLGMEQVARSTETMSAARFTMIRLAQLRGVIAEETGRRKRDKGCRRERRRQLRSSTNSSLLRRWLHKAKHRERTSQPGPSFIRNGGEKSSVFTGRVTTPTGRGGYCHDDDHQPFLSHRQVSITGTLTKEKKKKERKKGNTCACSATAAMTLALFRLFDFLLEKIMIHSFVVVVCGDSSRGRRDRSSLPPVI